MGEVVHLDPGVDKAELDHHLAAVRGALRARARRDPDVTDYEFRAFDEALEWVHRLPGDRFGLIWIGNESIAGKLGGKKSPTRSAKRSEKQERGRGVRRAMKNMHLRGYLVLVSKGDGRRRGGAGATTVYTLPGLNRPGEASLNRPGEASLNWPGEARELLEINLQKRTTTSSSGRARAKRLRNDDEEGSRLAPDWVPDADGVAFAENLGLDPIYTAERFRDYWTSIPGPKGRKLKWSGTWRNWCRREADSRPRGASSSSVASPAPAFAVGPLKEAESGNNDNAALTVSDAEWREELDKFVAGGRRVGTWPGGRYGISPTHNASRVPLHLRREYGFVA